MKEASYLIDYGDLLARFCLSFVFLRSGVSRASTMPIPLSLSGIVFVVVDSETGQDITQVLLA
jgi:hypothetical protein